MALREIGVLSDGYVLFIDLCFIGTCLAHTLFRVVLTQHLLIYSHSFNEGKKEEKMKKLMVQLFIIGVVIATYALPVLACGGGGP